MAEQKTPRFSFEQHPNLGYVVHADGQHVGSVQQQDDGKWYARADYHKAPTPWRTRRTAAEELQRIARGR
ncbi:hypothetical protein [Curtobacterium sp. MCBD17_040]|uniref:hypothetical protein n=1 Tax=Curtobacterium sp. MCBD17_040 TaxID=2175674 RepID=UPI000DA834C8|nr:hypothetical protein [Curtobacterium sp. MCBD17_040]WIB65871.1 hypothetical protein DEI94_17300 [Curtobacterium sp. MCBD17_040]